MSAFLRVVKTTWALRTLRVRQFRQRRDTGAVDARSERSSVVHARLFGRGTRGRCARAAVVDSRTLGGISLSLSAFFGFRFDALIPNKIGQVLSAR